MSIKSMDLPPCMVCGKPGRHPACINRYYRAGTWKSLDDLPDVEHDFDYCMRFAELLVPCPDVLPLHPAFYEFIQQDADGYFISDKDGNRWEIL